MAGVVKELLVPFLFIASGPGLIISSGSGPMYRILAARRG
jgi:hypothetical protein